MNGNIITRVSKRSFKSSHTALAFALKSYYVQDECYRAIMQTKIGYIKIPPGNKVKNVKHNDPFGFSRKR